MQLLKQDWRYLDAVKEEYQAKCSGLSRYQRVKQYPGRVVSVELALDRLEKGRSMHAACTEPRQAHKAGIRL